MGCGFELAEGYLNNAALTAERFMDGCFHSGDLASLAADGLLSIYGRRPSRQTSAG